MAENSLSPGFASEHLEPMNLYKESVLRFFPALGARTLEKRSISLIDAVALGVFLEHYRRSVVALDVGAFVGVSAFCFASHPNVSRVIGVDTNPVVSEELAADTDRWEEPADLESLSGLRTFDVAQTVLEGFHPEREKIELHQGYIGDARVGAKGGDSTGLRKVEVPLTGSDEKEGLVALVDGRYDREGILKDLKEIFGKNPHAVALLDDCRQGLGPLVQAGVADFRREAGEEYSFRLLADLGPGLSQSNFGILYTESAAVEIGGVLGKIRQTFGLELDPLLLQSQKEELQKSLDDTDRRLNKSRREKARLESSVSDLREQLAQARERNKRLGSRVSDLEEKSDWHRQRAHKLEEQRGRLDARYSSKRYKIADAVADRVLRIPGIKGLLRRYSE